MPLRNRNVHQIRRPAKTYPSQTDQELLDGLEKAVDLVYENDITLITHRVTERSVTPVICHYLRGIFPEHDVDTEYDRNQNDFKRTSRNKRFRPDLIVHQRGELYPHDLLIVEVKLEGRGSQADRNKDKDKLTFAVRNTAGDNAFRYQVGVFLELGPTAYSMNYI